MNRQELIERIDKLPYFEGPIADTVTVNREWILKSIEQLDEPQKVQVPQFVADWIDNMKCQGKTLYYGLDHTPPEEVDLWFCEDEVKRQETFARAWLDGYTVEEEKRYYVRFKFIEDSYSYLTLIKHLNAWTLYSITLDKKFRTEHTKKQLEEAGFGWVFDCEGIEIEEVEE